MGQIERGYFISRYTADEIEKTIERARATIPEDATISDMKARVCPSCGAPMPTLFYCEYCGTHYSIGGGSTLYADNEAVAYAGGYGGPTHNAGYLPDGKFCP